MSALGLAEIATRLGAAYSGSDLPVSGVTIDSRSVAQGDLFVALPGERVDGHDYVTQAASRGAVAAIVERPVDVAIPYLCVPSSLRALSEIGSANRDLYAGALIAITGSCGKTSVKNMCRSIFRRAATTVATVGNYNNEIGVPLTLARLDDDTRFAIVEMGATRRGDIAHLCSLARPQVSTVLNAMEAHLEGFGCVADVADIKAEIFDGLGDRGTAILNLDQPWVSLWRERIAAAHASTITYSLENKADVGVSELCDLGLDGSRFTLRVFSEPRPVTLPLPGRHNVSNALAAAALSIAAGLSLDDVVLGLEASEVAPGRLQSERLADGTILIDDSYNANPGSVRAAIDLLSATSGASTLVLGEMLELGEQSASKHAEMGEWAKHQGVACLLGVGAAVQPAVKAFGPGAHWVADRDELIALVPDLLESSATILVKGSRGAAMESVIAMFQQAALGDGSC